MILLALFVIALAVLVGVLLHWDLRKADRRRRLRGFGWFRIVGDLAPYQRAVARAARDLAEMTDRPKLTFDVSDHIARIIRERPVDQWTLTKVTAHRSDQRWEFRRGCRWCRVLAAVSLSHHAAHYVPRHRAASR